MKVGMTWVSSVLSGPTRFPAGSYVWLISLLSLPLSDGHEGVRHAWWDDEVQRKPGWPDWKGQAGDQDAHREM